MNIMVVGLGYVGVTAAACLAESGHIVVGVDVSASKVKLLQSGLSPISEPGISELVRKHTFEGRLTAHTLIDDLSNTNLVIVCVGTPSAPSGAHNMGFIAESARQIADAIQRAETHSPITVAFRSTFRPGTMDSLVRPIFTTHIGADRLANVELVYNPEFLRESTAIWDFNNPPKVVVGTVNGEPSSIMDELHSGLDCQRFNVGYREAELTKFIDNTWHAVKVSFANEIGRVAAALDIDTSRIHEIFVADTKLNISAHYLRPGGAFGGSCLPKDVRALQYIARDAKVQAQLIGALIQSNESHKTFQYERIINRVAPGATILVVGLAFKAGTDDLRESPSVGLARLLLDAGYDVKVYDPALDPHQLVGQNLGYTYTQLPEIGQLLVDKKLADTGTFDLVVATNSTATGLDLSRFAVLDLNSI